MPVGVCIDLLWGVGIRTFKIKPLAGERRIFRGDKCCDPCMNGHQTTLNERTGRILPALP
jgi:hypothetical protein